MIKLSEKGVFLASNNEIIAEEHFTGEIKKEEAKKGTIAWSILSNISSAHRVCLSLRCSMISVATVYRFC